jgi:hypothetical protein
LPNEAAPGNGGVLIGLQLSPRALDDLVTLCWLPEAERANPEAVSDAVAALHRAAIAAGFRPAAKEIPGSPEAYTPGVVRFNLAAGPAMQLDLVALGFLPEAESGDPDTVMRATCGLIAHGVSLSKDLDRFFVSLRGAKRRLDIQEDGGRVAALHALDTVLRYLMLFERTYTEGLLTPLALLFGDLVSLDGGAVGPMVAPAKKRGGARASGFYNALKGIAVFVARRLEASGLKRPDARKAVAAELAKMGVRPARKGSRDGTGQISARTIAKWQEDIAADVVFKTTAARELSECEISQERLVLQAHGLPRLPEGRTADMLELDQIGPAEFRRKYLQSLGQIALDVRLAPRKST